MVARLLVDKIAVVTGASKGIGRAIALRLGEAGARVVVHGGGDVDGAEETAGSIRQGGGTAQVVMEDLAAPGGCERFVTTAWDWQGRVDIWINNAGADVLTGDAAAWTFDEKLMRLWQVDVLATIACSRQAGDLMKRTGAGVILNMGWDQAWQGMAGDAGEMFSTIKGSVMAFSMSLAKSLAPEVRVNCLAPGWIRTSWGEAHASDYWQQRAIAESLRGRWGRPEDVAEAACFLASDAADFVTAHVLPVNGGFRSAASQSES